MTVTTLPFRTELYKWCVTRLCSTLAPANASYGTFKFTMVILNVATTLMLKVSERQYVCIIRAISLILFFGLNAAFIAIQATSLRVRFMEGNLVTRMVQIGLVLVNAIIFLFVIPWKDVVDPAENSLEIFSMRNHFWRALKRCNTFQSDLPQ